MKIMIISNLYPPYVLGGYEILCEQVVERLKTKGHTCLILTSDHQSDTSTGHIERSLTLYRPFSESAGFERKRRSVTAKINRKKTREAIRRIEPDVIFIWSLLRLTPGPARAAEESEIPVFYTFNDENIAGFARHPFSLHPRGFYHWFMDSFITPEITVSDLSFEHTTCISNVTKQNIISKGVPIHNSLIIHQGIPIDKFPLREKAPGTVSDPIRILYAGQLHPYKGVHTIIDALGTLSKEPELPDVTLTIAGTGPDSYLAELEKHSGRAGIQPDLIGRIPHDQMPALYRDHDIFVFPSIWQEPFGLTHLEAMASGLPVVSTVNGGQGEFLTHDENCLAFRPDDPQELAEALKRLLTDEQLRRKLAIAGRETVERGFTFSRYVDTLEKQLKTL